MDMRKANGSDLEWFAFLATRKSVEQSIDSCSDRLQVTCIEAAGYRSCRLRCVLRIRLAVVQRWILEVLTWFETGRAGPKGDTRGYAAR